MKSQFLLLSILLSSACWSDSLKGAFIYQYQNGATYRVTLLDGKNLNWECLAGGEKGAKGQEIPLIKPVSDSIYFLSWIEKTGAIVTQVLNLKSKKVYSTVVEGKERFVLEGDVKKE